MAVHHGRDQIQRLTLAAGPGRADPRPEGRPAGRHGRVPDARHAGHPAARRVHVQRHLQDGRLRRSPARACSPTKTPTDAYRGAGRPEATFAIERLMDELAAELGIDPHGGTAPQLDRARGVPVRDHRGPHLRHRATTRRPPTRRWSCSSTTSSAPSRPTAASGRTRCSWASGSRRSPRCAGWPRPACSARCRTARAAGSTRRCAILPTGKVEVVTGSSPHGQGHATAWAQIAADRLGVPFEDVTVLHGDTAHLAQGHGHLRFPFAGRRRRRPATRPARRWSTRPARSPRTCWRRPRTTSSSPTARSRPRRPEEGKTHPGGRAGRVRGARPARGHRAVAGRRRHVRPGELLLPPRHPPVRGRGRHRDRAS